MNNFPYDSCILDEKGFFPNAKLRRKANGK